MPSAESGDSVLPTIGSRVECNNAYGTIMFVGELPATQDLWIGLEWDDPSRGKHDGSYKGVQYFKTSFPTSGSFVRPSKLNFGICCPVAIKLRYGEVKNDVTAGIDKEIMAHLQKQIGAPFLEVVGFDKVNQIQSQFKNLRVACLSGEKIYGAGPLGELEELCPNLKEIDLSKNLLGSWDAIAKITNQLQNLQVLAVSENKLAIPESPAVLEEHFRSLRRIVLRSMDYTWDQILHLAVMWPDIEYLLAQLNNIHTLQIPQPGILSKLTYLNLEGNNIEDWEEINKLGNLPCLDTLNLSAIPLNSVWFPEGSKPTETNLFQNVTSIYLIGNGINKWSSVSELGKLKKLKYFRFRINPVLDTENMETCRQLVIASIGTLELLNGVPVLDQERKGAEYDYVKRHGIEWLAVKDNEDKLMKFALTYPRYAHLIAKYGAPEESELKVQSHLISDNLISIEIFNPDNLGPPKVKKFLPTMTVQKLSGYAQRLFDTGNKIPQLAYISSKNSDIEVPFDNELKQLNFYSIEDGDRISVRW